jgi:site-specific DNA-methyltransferase (adenine-specific)
VDIAGGVCYFLWERDSKGPCEVVNIHNGIETTSSRPLNEYEIFIRHSSAIPIIKKIQALKEQCMSRQVSSRKPFGLATNIKPMKLGDLTLRHLNGEGPYQRSEITTGIDLIEKWKVIASYVGYDHAGNPGKDGKRKVFSRIDILPPNSICTETYLVIGSYETKAEAENLISYMKTKFFRFLVAQFMYSHHITKDSYSFVPILDMNKEWNDDLLAKRYGLTAEEVEFIDSKIRSMD